VSLLRRGQKDPVDGRLHALVINRDRICFIAKVDSAHECRDQWGTPHRPTDLLKLTVDHVHLHAGGSKSKRAPSRKENLTAMCHGGNVGAPSKVVRQAQRDYLLELYPGSMCCNRWAA
jgi:hypothetical protein